jgi:hypothetical protein
MVLVYLLISAPTDLAYRSSKQVLNLYSDKEIICMLVWDGPVEGDIFLFFVSLIVRFSKLWSTVSAGETDVGQLRLDS